MGPELAIEDWGRTVYEDALARQAAAVGLRLSGESGDRLVLTEHEPVFTIGLRSGAARHLVWDDERLAKEGVTVSETNRGGDITYHGPGQLVAYPIVSIDRRRDLHAYLRFLEEVLIATARRFDLAADRRPGLTGIWIGPRKLAAIGVAVRRWIAYHGVALNVNPDLAHFSGIVPCGISAAEGSVTSLEAELGRPVDMAAAREALASEFMRLWPRFLDGGT